MEKTLFAVALLFLGLVFGSFVNAAVWRIKNKKDLLKDRSECTHCHHKLAWLDLIPVLSWVFLRGKCRYCKKPIDDSPLVELGVAAFFVASLAFWPFGFSNTNEILQFIVWLVAGIGLAILFVYDIKWLLLPDRVVLPLIGLGVIMTVLHGLEATNLLSFATDVFGSLLALSGFYLLLFMLSNGKWVGFGDVKLGAALALLLCDWKLALLTLFLANLIGTLIFAPALISKKIKRTSHVPFGPFLIVGFVIAGLFGPQVIDWYTALIYSGIDIPHQMY